jgi:DNA-binding transcriptional LysR family regulator
MDQFNLLKLMIEIADRGSLSAAAKALSISPSSATLGLQRLEDQARRKLVLRSTRRLSLSPEGERFVAEARSIVGHVADAFDAITESGPLSGPIKLTATHDFGRRRLIPLIDTFMRENTGISVSVILSDGVVDLAGAGFDLAIRISGQKLVDDPDARLLRQGTRRVCAAPAYWDRAGRPDHPRDLARHNCMVLARPDFSESTWAFKEKGKPLYIRVQGDRTASDGSAIRAWATAGAGVILNSSFDVVDDIESGALEPALDEFTSSEVNLYAISAKGRPPSRRVDALIEFLHLHI